VLARIWMMGRADRDGGRVFDGESKPRFGLLYIVMSVIWLTLCLQTL